MKRIIITGATKGIGRAIAEFFASKSFDLAVCSRSSPDLEELREAIQAKHPDSQVLIKKADLSKKEEVFAFADYIKTNWGTVDILVNNAGLYVAGEIHNEEDGVLESLMETNLYSAYHLTRAILPLMIDQKQGHVFNMCSIASLFSYPNAGSYTITKFALLGFSKVLREELKDKGVRVTTLLPGITWSNAWQGFEGPKNRLIHPEDIAKVIWSAWELSQNAVVEELLIRPQLGDL